MSHRRLQNDTCHPEGNARGTFEAAGKVPRYARDDNSFCIDAGTN